MKKGNSTLISFLQALGLSAYIFLVASFIWNAEKLVGKMNNFMGPLLLLSIFVLSAMTCGLIVFSYPAYLFWEKKKVKQSLKLVAMTAGWLALFVVGIIFYLAVS